MACIAALSCCAQEVFRRILSVVVNVLNQIFIMEEQQDARRHYYSCLDRSDPFWGSFWPQSQWMGNENMASKHTGHSVPCGSSIESSNGPANHVSVRFIPTLALLRSMDVRKRTDQLNVCGWSTSEEEQVLGKHDIYGELYASHLQELL